MFFVRAFHGIYHEVAILRSSNYIDHVLRQLEVGTHLVPSRSTGRESAVNEDFFIGRLKNETYRKQRALRHPRKI